ncbi:KilA domain protein [Neisseria bacilliformis ATCC BAA-1200]|uniref:KilA domain protein n=1 Tax=Neisseria bacilliformis ATCC BAA-1200 TaxID=888742 RepID=F2BBN0_9NEIS|nr:KilA-N domain-containing protein [Neisseria bacilliformis]EGF11176.1 KilA domain protein [Neisseria bacilliformis ATCC BAA-1200]QMT48213.1 KilA-N domain-containing protein [Neisseria bacilliformis]
MNAIAISNVAIRQTENNLYNLNDLHKASGGEKRHELTNWLKLQQTTELIDELSKPGIPGLEENQQVIQVVKGGNKRGTYACKELVYAYATWISAKFFLQVIRTFDAVISGSLTPRKALLSGLTHEQQAEVKALHNILIQSVPFEKQKALAITLWSAVKSKFKVGYKDVPPEQFPEVLSLMARVAVEKGVLYGELLDKQPAPVLPVLDDETVLAFGRLLVHAQDMRLFVNRYLPAFQNLGIDGRGSLWSFVHDTEPTFAAVRRFMAAQSVHSGFFARDWAWVQSRILSTAQAF